MRFFDAVDFENTIRNAVSLGGDSDTLAAIAGFVAEAFYGIPSSLLYDARICMRNYIDIEELDVIDAFCDRFCRDAKF